MECSMCNGGSVAKVRVLFKNGKKETHYVCSQMHLKVNVDKVLKFRIHKIAL